MTNHKLVNMPSNPKIMRFNVTLSDGDVLRVQTELAKSGAFDYGNGTCVIVTVNEDDYQIFDTRYLDACYSVDGYREYFSQWVKSHWASANVEQIY